MQRYERIHQARVSTLCNSLSGSGLMCQCAQQLSDERHTRKLGQVWPLSQQVETLSDIRKQTKGVIAMPRTIKRPIVLKGAIHVMMFMHRFLDSIGDSDARHN